MAAGGRSSKRKRTTAKRSSGKKRSATRAPATKNEQPKDPAAIPSGKRLNAAQQALRDSLMLQRRAQSWEWPEIAAEAGLTVSGAKAAVRKRKESLPALLNQDPMVVIDDLVNGFLSSIGDFEKMAGAYSVVHPSAAVGAKKAADEARWKLATLLQATGTLPRELGTLRHLVEVRGVVVELVDGMDQFLERVTEATKGLPAKRRQPVLDAASDYRERLTVIAGEAREKRN